MDERKLHLIYDEETDILHIALGTAREAISIERDDEVFLRVDPNSGELLGLTILNFRDGFLKIRQSIEVPLAKVAV